MGLAIISIAAQEVVEIRAGDIQTRIECHHELDEIDIEVHVSESESHAYSGLKGIVFDGLLYDSQICEKEHTGVETKYFLWRKEVDLVVQCVGCISPESIGIETPEPGEIVDIHLPAEWTRIAPFTIDIEDMSQAGVSYPLMHGIESIAPVGE